MRSGVSSFGHLRRLTTINQPDGVSYESEGRKYKASRRATFYGKNGKNRQSEGYGLDEAANLSTTLDRGCGTATFTRVH
jgi:hypothetical protein